MNKDNEQREIKFRAWDGKKMLHDGDPGGMDGLRIMHDSVWYYEESNDQFYWNESDGNYKFMQFTGLLDKNGKEIYEGDRLGREGFTEWIVTWKHGGFMVYNTVRPGDIYHISKYECETNREIIGNIYSSEPIVK